MSASKQLRARTLAARNQLPESSRRQWSAAICQQLLELDLLKKAKSIFVYVSFRSEVETLMLIEELLRLDKHVLVPITRLKENIIEAVRITDLHRDLEPGYCDIPEPKPELCTLATVQPSEVEVILLPGSVFDHRGGRYGYGGGYYDRFLAANPAAIRIGLAFETQLVAELELAPHDQLLDYVVTEKRCLRGDRGGK